ncbi:hypothetical protein NDU88_001546 [Pleurodeles waltl]|uniref:Secreted protein n=1 Tax=Pleurodeles waltl TaxID=8319 RepID=A0AAV7NJD2_PLEWA|nr:hypothetical protein NDU88_001546 [Pleurodeles waltl]
MVSARARCPGARCGAVILLQPLSALLYLRRARLPRRAPNQKPTRLDRSNSLSDMTPTRFSFTCTSALTQKQKPLTDREAKAGKEQAFSEAPLYSVLVSAWQ